MKDCKGTAEVMIRIKLSVSAQVNTRYADGRDVLSKEAEDCMYDMIPKDIDMEVVDVRITNYEQTSSEREAEDEI